MHVLVLSAALAMILFTGVGTAFAATIYGDSVEASNQLLKKDGSAITDPTRMDPAAALGAPDGSFFSLGFGGSVTIEFASFVGSNLTVSAFEVTGGAYPAESANVEVSQDGSSWTSVGNATNNDGGGPNPFESSFALPADTCIKFIRITDTTNPDLHTDDADAFDVEAVSATFDEECTPEEPEPPTPCNCGCGSSSSSSSSVVNGISISISQSGCINNTTSASASTGGNTAGGSRGGRGGRGGDVRASAFGGNSIGNNGGATAGNGGAGGAGAEGGFVQSGNATANASTTNILNRIRIRIGL